ncbi:MAG: MgtC/SapB family protein [Limnochordales bacterium]
MGALLAVELTYWELFARLLLATVLGGAIGLERETLNRPAGLRTHILVCVGSTLAMLVSMYGLLDMRGGVLTPSYDGGRIAAQVISGIGFLGAGTILREGSSVRGLTTAASLWTVAGIGLAVGSGMYAAAVATTLLVMLALKYLVRVERRWLGVQRDVIVMRIVDKPGMIAAVSTVLAKHKIDIRGVEIDADPEHEGYASLELSVVMAPRTNPLQVVDELGAIEGVVHVGRGDFSR